MGSNLSLPSPSSLQKESRKEKKERKRNQRESSNNGSLHSPTSPDLLTRMIDAADQTNQAQTSQAFYSSQSVGWLLQGFLPSYSISFSSSTLRRLPCRLQSKKEKKSVIFRSIYYLHTGDYLHYLLQIQSIDDCMKFLSFSHFHLLNFSLDYSTLFYGPIDRNLVKILLTY